MAKWMQVLAVALAAVVGLVPAFAQVSYAQAVSSSSVVLPVGDELEEEDLLDAEGELLQWGVALAAGAVWALGWAVYDAFFDGEPGFQHTRTIVGGGLAVYCGVFLVWGQVSTLGLLIDTFLK